MAAKYWLKLYYDMLDDSKIGKLREATRWRFIECLLVAGECDDDGYIPDIQEYAWRVRSDAESVETDFVTLADAGLLSQDSGRWKVTKFAERQGPVGDTERWRQWRDRQRKQEYNEKQTDFKRDQTEVQTNRLTDTDKIRIDKIRIEESPNGDTPTIYELPEDAHPFSDAHERRQEMVTAISGVVRETCAIGVTEDKFNQAADAFIADGLTTEDVKRFSNWWSKQDDRPYAGKPWLKSLVQNIKESLSTGSGWEDWLSDAKDFRNSS
jgi:hypothetical protein